jgi:hypothetical protein
MQVGLKPTQAVQDYSPYFQLQSTLSIDTINA